MRIDRRRFSLSAVAAGGVLSTQTKAKAATLEVDEAAFVNINGVEQWVQMRGQSRSNPVLLMLHGGPGGGLANLSPLFAEWEKTFTVVIWDQPGSGVTDRKNPHRPGPMTIERFVKDGLAVAEHVRRTLGVRKIAVFGNSWGTVLGLEMVHRRPDLFSAYIGTAQVVGPEGGRVGYEMGLAAARKRGDAAAVAALEKVGPPPYATMEEFFVRQAYTNAPGLPPTPQEAAASAEVTRIMRQPQPEPAYRRHLPPSPPGYDGGFIASQQATFKEVWAWDAQRLGLEFKLPVFMFNGEVDLNTPTSVVRAYFNKIKAPSKTFVVVHGAGHGIITFRNELLGLLTQYVLPAVKS